MRALLVLAVASAAIAAPKPRKKAPAPHAAAKRPRPTEKTEGTGGISPGSLVGPPELLFTFDDGPAVDKTPKVLDLLDQHHIKAVFFVNGWHFQGNRAADEKAKAVLRETLKRGHA